MPKAKPTQVIVHRIELQQSERDMVEAALAGNFVTNAVGAAGSVFTGIGQVLAPFGGVFAAIAGVYLADKALDEIIDAAKDAGEAQKRRNEETYSEAGYKRLDYMRAMVQTYYAEGGWDGLLDLLRQLIQWKNNPVSLYGPQPPMELLPLLIPTWWADVCIQFLGTITDPNFVNMTGKTPAELWAEWYTIEQHNQAAYYHDTNGSVSGGVWKTIFG
jgi:hypothetical protein